MKQTWFLLLSLFALSVIAEAQPNTPPLRVGIVGLVHGHVAGFLNGSALVPAGGIIHRSDVEIVGVVEPDRKLFDKYAEHYHWPANFYFASVRELIAATHPQAALVFTNTFDHTAVVEECARRGVHVLMEKPMAVSYQDALRMQAAAERGKVHVLVDYETSWYPSNWAARDLLSNGALGSIVKTVIRDGHRGPKLIHVQPEFFRWLTDPKLNGAGALYDFGCYGADLMTWLMQGEAPVSVTAVTQELQPDIYPNVDDEANIILAYSHAVAILQASWNWPIDVKDMAVFGRTGFAQTRKREQVEVQKQGEKSAEVVASKPVPTPYDDPIHYLSALIRGEIAEDGSLSSLKTNVLVSEILDAARQSARSGKTVKLPLRE